MALLSTNFMAGTGLYGESNQPDKLDVSDVLAAILLKDTATLGQIAMSGSVNNIEHFWFEDSLNDAYASISLSMDTDNTAPIGRFSQLSSSASVGQVLRAGSLVRPEGYDMTYRVISQSTDTSIVPHASVTAAASSFPIATSVAMRFLVVGMPKSDIATYSDDISRTRTRRKNFTQVFERGIQIAETREHIDAYGIPDELKHQIKNRTYEIKRELNNAVVNGHPSGHTAASPDSEVRTMGGILSLIRNPAMATVRDANEYTIEDAAGAALNMTLINSLAEKIYQRGGFDDQSNCCLIVGPAQARVIAMLEEQRIRRSSKELVVGSYANKIKTDLGFDLDVVLDRWFPPDVACILDKSRVKLMPLQGDSWHMEKMAKTSRVQGYQLSGQYTIEMRNPNEAHGMAIRLAWS